MREARLMDTSGLIPPPLPEQADYWDRWNREARLGELNPYMARLRDVAVRWAGSQGGRPRILEVGCGAGWTAEGLSRLGPVVGVDLSPRAVEAARRRCPDAEFITGDFFNAPLSGPFDVVTTADTIAHVSDQQAFVDRVADLLRPGGTFVLMTQNPFAFRRSSWVPPVAPGQIRHWPDLHELRTMLARDFEVHHVTTAAPLGADSGIFRLTNARRVWGAISRLLGTARATRLYEWLRLGSELVVVARRR